MRFHRQQRGFTLIEMMVSVGLFALVMTLAAGAYLTIISLSRQAQAVSTAVDGVSSTMEYMTREIRTGSAYSCSTTLTVPATDCAAGGATFSLLDQDGSDRYAFSLLNGSIYQNGTDRLTDPSIVISSLKFYVVGTHPYSTGQDTTPPHVTITVSGSISAGKTTYPFTLESGATMRGSDL